MEARNQRGIRALLSLSARRIVGVTALLSAIGLGTVAARALDARHLPVARLPRLENPPVSAGPASAGAPAPAAIEATAPLRQLEPRPGNRAPLVRDAHFTNERVTALGDLRLSVEAWDPDGDPISLRTTWWIDGERVDTDAPVLTRDRFSRGKRLRAFVVASDGSHESEAFATPEIVVENAPPMITTYPTGFDATGAFVYPIGVIDADGDRDLEFRLVEGPAGMRIEAHEGTLTWRPGIEQVGRHAVRVEVHDGRGGSESQVFALKVRRVPTPAADLAER